MSEVNNLLAAVRETTCGEVFEELLRGESFKLERIVSTGQVTPDGEWYDQETDEWIVLLAGAARLRFESPQREIELHSGDYMKIPARCRHRVEWTDPTQSTVWLALHYQADAATANVPHQ